MSKPTNGDMPDLTLRLLREIRAAVGTIDSRTTAIEGRMASIEERMTSIEERMATKEDLAKLDNKLTGRIDVLGRIIKDNVRVLSKRIRRVEIRTGIARAT